MKKVILLLALIFSIASFAQEKRKWRGSFLLSGEVANLNSGEVVLTYIDVTRKGDEPKKKIATVTDGRFGFSDFIEEPAFATLKIGDDEYTLFLDPTPMKVVVLPNKEGLQISGSWTNDDNKKIVALDEKINELAVNGAKNSGGNLIELSYASVVKDSFVVLLKMLEVANPKHPHHSDVRSKQMIGILMNMSDELKDTPSGVRTSELLFLSSVKMFAQ